MKKVYGIVGTQRSGSNYICSVLRKLDGMGDPREYFSPVHIHEENKRIQAKEDAITFAKELLENTANDSYFSFKIHYLQFFENFLQKGIKLHDAFPNMSVIFLRRTNVVAQAISLWKAELTQSWVSSMEAKKDPHYNFEGIRRRYFDLKIHDLMWEKYLRDEKISYLNIIYEDMEKNESKFFFNILSFIGESDKFDKIAKPEMKKQANQQSIEWEKRFRKEYAKIDKDENTKIWKERTKYWDAQCLGDNPNIWRKF